MPVWENIFNCWLNFVLASSPLFNFVTRKQDLRPAASGGRLSAAGPVSGQFVRAPNSNEERLLTIIITACGLVFSPKIGFVGRLSWFLIISGCASGV